MQSTDVNSSSCSNSSTGSNTSRRRRTRRRRRRRTRTTARTKSNLNKNNINDSSSERATNLRNCRQFHETYEVHLWGSWRDVDDIFDLRYLYDDSEILESKRQLIEDFDYYGNPHYYNYHCLDDYEEELEQREQEQAEESGEQKFDFAILNENLELVFGENDELRLGGVGDFLVAEQLQQQIDAAAAAEAEAAEFAEQAAAEEEEEEEEENWDNGEYNVRFDMRLGFITDDYDSGYDEPNSRKEEYPPLEEDLDVYNDSIDEAQQRLADMLVELHLRHVGPLAAVNSS